jgi:hypothetical protein
MVVGIVGAVVTWFSGAEHDKNSFAQETMRAQASFTRAQQVAAYTAFTNAFGELALAFGYEQFAIVTQYPYDIQIAPTPASKQDSETLYANFVNTMNVVAFSGPAATSPPPRITVVSNELHRQIPDIAETEEPAGLLSAFVHGIKRLPVAWTPPR